MRKITKLLVLILLIIPTAKIFAQETLPNSSCEDCHSDSSIESAYVTEEHLKGSVHVGLDCTSCHSNVSELPHDEELPDVDCGTCHQSDAASYQIHGWKKVGTDRDLPGCKDCHGTHLILTADDPRSLVSPRSQPRTCGRCHEDPDFVKEHKIAFREPAELYLKSVHGKATADGVEMAASCNDCHATEGTPHDIRAPGDPVSSISIFNIPKTCGRCHKVIYEEYKTGSHGIFLTRGEVDAPTCTTCHGKHNILENEDPHSTVHPNRVAKAVCGPCHESDRIKERYGIPGKRLSTYIDSYHGLKSSIGDISVATCASCHGAHSNLPPDDLNSTIYSQNRIKTCGACHAKISQEIAMVPIHRPGARFEAPLAGLIRKIYFYLIIVVVGALFFHNILDIRCYYRKSLRKPQIKRMTANEATQHAFLALAFTLLVISGFALRHSESWWSEALFGWESGFAVRGIIHRVASVLLMITALWHLGYLSTENGRRYIRGMLPKKRDFCDLYVNIKRLIGKSDDFPQFGRFTYGEKFEYWAMIWGTMVMTITGFMLWFDNTIVKYLPKGFLDVILVIHYYEALLASLAVVVWHFYNVVFNPAVYPMNASWLTGTMPKEVYRHEHSGDESIKEPADSGRRRLAVSMRNES